MKWKDKVRMGLGEPRRHKSPENVRWMKLAQDRVQRWCRVFVFCCQRINYIQQIEIAFNLYLPGDIT
jgi:hypothetical protein